MSEIKVNKISPKQTCTQLTLGDSGDTIIVTSGANFNTDAIKNLNTSSIITQTNATTITLGFSGSTIAIASGATQTGFGRSGSVNWDTTPKTANFTAVSGNGYFVDTTTTTLTVNLPAGVAGDIVAISDYANTAATNNITIDPNGTDKINGTNENAIISTNGASITLVYIDATRGWKDVGDATLDITGIPPFVVATGGTIVTCGDFKTHIFTGPGTFTVTCAGGPGGSNSVDYLVVAGGGGAGTYYSGGGGAGGFRQNFPSPATAGLPVTAQAYPITVGAGGAGVPGPGNAPGSLGNSGNPSIFSTITSTGGGGGGSRNTGGSGGSGGGGGNGSTPGGSGNTPPTSPSQGNNGGNGNGTGGQTNIAGGGGGGASAAGTNGVFLSVKGVGGNGSPIATTFFGPTSPSYGTPGPAPGRYFAGGGGGAFSSSPTCRTTGGAGGGGPAGNNGPSGPPTIGTAGTANTGGGAGGGGENDNGTAAAGGSGIVVIRYKFQ
jgi:hypothetical protein